MSVGDLHDVERSTGQFALAPPRVRRPQPVSQAPADRANTDDSRSVPIAVLSTDAALADAIHDAAASAHPVATATTPDEALELAAHGRCAILVTDQVSTYPALQGLAERLREMDPAIVVIAVGCAADQSGLIKLLSDGVVDRLMLKPVTPSLAQIVLKSAAQQHRTHQVLATAETRIEHREPAVVLVDLQRHAANDTSDLQPSPTQVVAPASAVTPVKSSRRRRIEFRRPHWIALVVAALLALGFLAWWVAADHKPAIDPHAVIASSIAAGQRAFHEGHELEPRGRSAFDYYTTVLALDPANIAARQGIDQIADRFAAQAGIAIAGGQIAAAIVAVDSIRRVRPDYPQLRQLETQLGAAQEKYAAAAPERVEPVSQPAGKSAAPKSGASSTSSEQNMTQVIQARARAVSQVSEALKQDQLELASALLSEARALGVPAAEVAAMTVALTSAQQRREQEELQHLAQAEKSFGEASLMLSSSAIGADGTAESAGSDLEPAIGSAAPAPKPKLARMVKPEYPQDALITGAEGWVNVSMSITPAGNVLEPRVVESSNGTLFDRAAISAVRKWKYEPFSASEAQHVTVRVDFRMKGRR